MGGLQARIVPYSKVLASARIDAEFSAHPMADELEAIASRGDVKPLLDLTSHISSGHTPYKHDVKSGDVGFVTVECVSPMEFHEGKLKAVTTEQFEKEFARQRIRKGDVLCTIKRRICQAYPWLAAPKAPLAINQDVALLRPNASANAAYLAAYLSSSVGQGFADRQKTEQMNPYISLVNLKSMPVVIAPRKLQIAIEATVSHAREFTFRCETLSNDAGGALLADLGLANWTPPEPLSYTASSSDAFASGRLDAQFFAPRIQQFIDHLSGAGTTVGSVSTPRREKFDAAKHGDFDYIEIGDLDGTGTTGSSRVAADEAPSRATWFVRPGDIITSTVRPIRRLSAQIAPDQDGYVCSSGFVVLDPTGVQPELLLTYLRLPAICELMDLFASASMYPAISEPDILALPFPAVDAETEQAVVSAVQEGRAARARARALLDAAKRAVEIAIEDSEAAALAYLDKMGAA